MRAVCVGLLCLLLASGSAAEDAPPANAVLVEVPFLEHSEPGRIVVDLAPPEGRRFPLILDTGATHTVITPRMARSLGISVRRTKFDPYRRPTRLGRDLLFFVDDSVTDTAGAFGFEYGLLGGNFLAEYVVELDMRGRRMRLLDAGRYEVPAKPTEPGAVTLPLRVISNRPSVEVNVAGQRMLVMLDTGSHGGLMLSGELSDRAGVVRRPDLPSRFFTLRGEVASVLGTLERLRVGPFAFAPMPVIVLPNGWFNFGLSKDAVIGMDLLSQFLVRIDYPRERLWLRRRDDWQVAWKAERWTGWPPPGQGASQVVRQTGGSLPSIAAVSPAVDLSPEELEPARAAKPAVRRVWLEVAVPAEGEEHVARIGWAEVRGWAGSDTPTRHDVMVIVDVSGSTAWASGADVDGDGEVGRARPRREADRWKHFNPRRLSSDAGDSVLAAELVATRRLIELLDPVRTRVGLASFASGAVLLAPLGSDGPELAGALKQLEENFGSGATNLSAALDLGRKVLVAAGGKGRQKSILLLSDGYPTAPGSAGVAAQEAWKRAEEAKASEVRIYSFSLGLNEIEEDDVYAAIAAETRGRYVRIARPAEIVEELPRINLAQLAGIAIENLTTGGAGQAIRLFPDGSFDAFVQLAPGQNVLRVTARGEDGAKRSEERRVFYDAREPASPEEKRAFEAEAGRMKAALRLRALEMELGAEARHRASDQERRLEIELEETSE